MQTPLMELIEWMNSYGSSYEVILKAKAKATELLEKEREVICKAFSDGKHHGAKGSNPNDRNKRYNYLTSKYWEDTFTKTFTGKND